MSKNWQEKRAHFAALRAELGMTPAELDPPMTPCTPNGRAVAAAVFTQALTHWPDFYDTDDEPPLRAWGSIFDYWPFITPEVAARAVDAVAHKGITHPLPRAFVDAALEILADEQ